MSDFYGSATAALTIFLICFYNYFSSKKDRDDLDKRAEALLERQAKIAEELATSMTLHIAGLKQVSEDSLRQLRADIARASRDRIEQTQVLTQRLAEAQSAVQTDVAENTSVTKATLEQAVVAKEAVTEAVAAMTQRN